MNQRVLNQIFKEITDPNRLGGPFDGSQGCTEKRDFDTIDNAPC